MLQMPDTMPVVEPDTMQCYTVTCDTPKGLLDVENLLSTLGPEAAARRAFFTLVHNGYGDLDDVTIAAVVVTTHPLAGRPVPPSR